MQREKYINPKNRILSIFVILIYITLSACTFNDEIKNNFEEENVIMKVALFRFSDEIYLFTLEYDGTLNVLFGDRYLPDITDRKNIDIVIEESKMLSEDEMEQFNQIINQLQEFEAIGRAYGGWEVIIKLKDREYQFTYGLAKDKNFDELITMLIGTSAFKMVRIQTEISVRPIS